MLGFSKVAAMAGAAALAFLSIGADGHAYCLDPPSRQVYYSPVYQEWPFEPMEYCPSCYNARGPKFVQPRAIELTDPTVLAEYGKGEWPLLAAWEKGEVAENGNFVEIDALAVRHGVCGDPEQNAEEDLNMYSTANKGWPILSTYQSGGTMDMKIVMTAYHWGHFEFHICNADDLVDADGVPNQGCFNMHPLTRTAGDDLNSPIDPNYPGRYYADPECREDETDQEKPEGAAKGYVMHMKYDLPNIECKRCILQMTYYTGNSCKHVGYDEFEPSSWPSTCAPNKADWIELDRRICGEDGTYPEEFWACSDIALTADGEPNATPAPTPPIPDCLDPVEPYEQCGGDGWTGSDCCRDGYECTEMGSCYSQCRPIEGGCAEDWKQCGGTTKEGYWEGPTCCWPGATCTYKDKYYSVCQPDDWVPE